jgi:hypothetical protein
MQDYEDYYAGTPRQHFVARPTKALNESRELRGSALRVRHE